MEGFAALGQELGLRPVFYEAPARVFELVGRRATEALLRAD
jgi:hypothetical protein